MNLLDDLNPRQREAVLATEGPVLVLAGAGSGKTRVITYRVAWLLQQGVPAEALLAVTFTNKAAGEMKERVERLAARCGLNAGEPWVSTFHSFCARLLRREAPRLGLPRSFAIYDEDDQLAALKIALRRLGGNEHRTSLRGALSLISHVKNHGQGPEELARRASDPLGRIAAELFPLYEEVLRKDEALDFDDLLLRAVAALREHSDCRRHWAGRFRFIQVDEYQDTNRPQYELVGLLAGEHKNLCVVGDEDQSIYSWRGADVGNILRFEKHFPGTRVIRLEENYRSTQTILDAAAGVVGNNTSRLGKSLQATRGPGRKLRYFAGRQPEDEALFVAQETFHLLRDDPGAHVAVLYRTNFQSRAFEDAFRRLGLSYRMLGGFSFYQRAEVKDLLAYVRLALNPNNVVALQRIINTPPRGIGKTTIEALQQRASTRGISLWAAVAETIAAKERPVAALSDFQQLIEDLGAECLLRPPAEFLRYAIERTGYLAYAEQLDAAEHTSRAGNLHELVTAFAEATANDEPLVDVLDRAALVSDADNYDEHASVTLLTLHSAKGLEFDHVFLVGMEDGLFPHKRASESAAELEEERRLCYVGMTRAKDTLTLTRAIFRPGPPGQLSDDAFASTFLSEVPRELLETAPGSLLPASDAWQEDPAFQSAAARLRAEPGVRRYVPDPEHEVRQRFPRPRQARAGSAAGNARARRAPANPLIGMRVRHAKFGVGTILAVEEHGEDRKLTISFPGFGTKKLLESYAHLERA